MSESPGLSYQLYSSRKFPSLARQCSMLAEIGYSHVEPYSGLFSEMSELEQALNENGLTAPSCHIGLEPLREDFDAAFGKLKQIGVEMPVIPFIQPAERAEDRAGWEKLGAELSDLAKRFADKGMRLGWHNHDFEFASLADGSQPMALILDNAPELFWEADLAWIIRGNADPLDWMSRYGDRIAVYHVKDIAPAGEKLDEDGWADVGTGIVNFAAYLPALHASTVKLWIAEHDNPSDDARFARAAYAAMSSWSKPQ